MCTKKVKYGWVALLLALVCPLCGFTAAPQVKWVDFNAGEWALKECLRYAAEFEGGDSGYDFSDAVAYLAWKNGNRFSVSRDRKTLTALCERLRSGEKFADIFPDNDYAAYLRVSYGAVLKPLVGAYTEEDTGERKFGLKCCFRWRRGTGTTTTTISATRAVTDSSASIWGTTSWEVSARRSWR